MGAVRVGAVRVGEVLVGTVRVSAVSVGAVRVDAARVGAVYVGSVTGGGAVRQRAGVEGGMHYAVLIAMLSVSIYVGRRQAGVNNRRENDE